jgi:hypothetical protein
VRLFNRLIVSLLLAGLVALGVFTVLYSFDLFGYRLADLPRDLGLTGLYEGLRSFVDGVESGSLPVYAIVALIAVALVGLALLIAELKPARPSRVRIQRGTFITREAVAAEISTAANRTRHVLESSVRIKARRRPGAHAKVRANMRRGEDPGPVGSELRERIRQRLLQSGVPIGKLDVKLAEIDPRNAKARVR